MRLLKVTITIILFCLLTVLTQVGGLVYLLSILTYKLTDKWAYNHYQKAAYRFTSFLTLYCITTFLMVPVIAKPFGRVPLPMTETNHLQPLNMLTCFLNRNYVRHELRQTAFEFAKQMNYKFPGKITNYLDANFPFIDKFPLIPHLNHNDGKKLDLSFCYRDTKIDEPQMNVHHLLVKVLVKNREQMKKKLLTFVPTKDIGSIACWLKLFRKTAKRASYLTATRQER